MTITILADLDGTLLPRPFGTGGAVAHPSLSSGPAFAPLVRLLELGATVVGVTGSQLSTHRDRFFDDLPLEYRRRGRVLLAVQTGSFLYRPNPDDGRPVRDNVFATHLARSVPTGLDDEVVEALVAVGRDGIRHFYSDLAGDPSLVDPDGPLSYLLAILARCSSADEIEVPVSDDIQVIPRIEVREGNSAVVFVGVPSPLGARYFAIPENLMTTVDGRPTGRCCFDCVPSGLDKSHVVRYLIDAAVVENGRAVAIGDQPAGNDEGLTRWHRDPRCSIPFIAVSEREAMVPKDLRDCHVTKTSNAEASAAVLHELADLIEQHWCHHGHGAVARALHLDVGVISDLVGRVNKSSRV